MSRREAFFVESALMLANNLIFFVMWRIFFLQFPDVAGWNFQDMLTLTAVGMGGYGLSQIWGGGTKNLSRMILNGDLDPLMTQPKNLLLHVVGSKVLSKGWGHLMAGFILIPLGGIASVYTLPLILLSMVSGGLVFTAVHVMVHSLAFWMGPMEGLAKKYCDALFLFALYPTNIYSGLLQLVMFTLIPAGVITYLPVELVRHFSWALFLALAGSTIAFVAAACWVFYAGLKRYASGHAFGMRG